MTNAEEIEEALRVQEKISDLNIIIKKKKLDEIHENERKEFEDFLSLKLSHLNSMQKEFIKENKEQNKEAERLVEEMRRKQAEEIEEFNKSFEENWSNKNPGSTAKILNHQRSISVLCKKKLLEDAYELQKNVLKLKEDHLNDWNGRVKVRTHQLELNNLLQRQKTEMSALLDKIKRGRKKFQLKTNEENKRQLNKFNAKEKELLNAQNRKRNQYLKYNHLI